MQCTGAAHGSRRVWVGYGYQLVALNITSWCVQYKFRLRLLACLLACLLVPAMAGFSSSDPLHYGQGSAIASDQHRQWTDDGR